MVGNFNWSHRQTSHVNVPLNALGSLRSHWPEYLMEAGESASYMFLVCTFATVLLHPISPVSHLIHSALRRRALMGLLVGSAVVVIILTPWGKQSGGHFNPGRSRSGMPVRRFRMDGEF